MLISALQIPDPYHFLIQVRYKYIDIYESYFSQLINIMEDGTGLMLGIHIESKKLSVEKFEYMSIRIGYNNVVGYIVIREDGEIICSKGDIDAK